MSSFSKRKSRAGGARLDPTGGLATLSKNPAVIQCGLNPDGSAIWIEYVGGIEGLVSLLPPDSLGGGAASLAQPSRISTLKSSVLAPALRPALRQATSKFLFGPVSFPSSGSYIGMFPFMEKKLGTPSAVNASNDVSNACTGPVFPPLINQDVDVNSFTALGSYGIIYIDSHGNLGKLGEPLVSTGELATLASRAQHGPDLNATALILTSNYGNTYFSLSPLFILRHYGPGSFQRSLVIISSCYSLENNQMADAFLLRGASAFAGWVGPVSPIFGGEDIVSDLFSGLSDLAVPADSRTLQQVLGVPGLFAPSAILEAVTGAPAVGLCSPSLTVQKTGPGSVTSTPAGIDCGPNCTSQFDGPVTLTALPNSGSVFVGWRGDCAGSASSTTIQVTTGKSSCVANFSIATQLTVYPNSAAQGQTVTIYVYGDPGLLDSTFSVYLAAPCGTGCYHGTPFVSVANLGPNLGGLSASVTIANDAPIGPLDVVVSSSSGCPRTYETDNAFTVVQGVPLQLTGNNYVGAQWQSIYSVPSGINCSIAAVFSTGCSAYFPLGSVVYLFTEPADPNTQWSNQLGTHLVGSSIFVTMNQFKHITVGPQGGGGAFAPGLRPQTDQQGAELASTLAIRH